MKQENPISFLSSYINQINLIKYSIFFYVWLTAIIFRTAVL